MMRHFFNLLSHAWANLLASLGTTTLAIVLFTLAFPVVTFVVTVFYLCKRHPPETLRAYIRGSFTPTAIGFMVGLFFLSVLFGWNIIRTGYNDHQTLVGINQTLQTENAGLTGEVTNLKHQIEELKNNKSSQPPPRPAPATIHNVDLEFRLVCSLRDPTRLPPDLTFAILEDPHGTYLEGAIGKSYLSPITKVAYKRTEDEGKASMTFRYELPANSDLIGQPFSRLSSYDKLAINAWGTNGDDFTGCNYYEVTFRVNGEDVYKTTASITKILEPKKSITADFRFRHLKLPQ